MWAVGFIFILLLIPLTVYGQSSSQSDLCPSGTKAEVRGLDVICVSSSGTPSSTIPKQSPTSIVPDLPSTRQISSSLPDLTQEQWFIVISFFLIFVLAIAIKIKLSLRKPRKKQFTKKTKDLVKRRQKIVVISVIGTYLLLHGLKLIILIVLETMIILQTIVNIFVKNVIKKKQIENEGTVCIENFLIF